MSNRELSRWEPPQRPNNQQLSERRRAAQIAAQRCPCLEHDRLFAEEMAREPNSYNTNNTAYYSNVENTQNNNAPHTQHNNVRVDENTAYYNNVGNSHNTTASQNNDLRSTNNYTNINYNTYNTHINVDSHPSININQQYAPQSTRNASAYSNENNYGFPYADMSNRNTTQARAPTYESSYSSSSSQRPPPTQTSHAPSDQPSPYESPYNSGGNQRPPVVQNNHVSSRLPPVRPPLRVRALKPVKEPNPNHNFLYGKHANYSKHAPPKEDTKCHVEGCKEHRVHRRIAVNARETKTSWYGATEISTKSGDLKVKSLFCNDHTCRSGGAGNGGRFCQNPSYPEDRRCAECVAKGREE